MASNADSVVEAVSPAAKYKQMLLETGSGTGPNEDKMILVFKVVDQIIPHLGVFVEVMKMCRDELFEAVYSDQYTGSDTQQRYIQRLPFFTLVKRVYDQRDEANEKLNKQLDMVKEKLFDKQVTCEELCDKIADLEKHAANMKDVIGQLETDLANRNHDFDSLQMTLEEMKDEAEKTEYQLNCDIVELKEDLQEARTEAAFLQQYKSGYDDLQDAFQDDGGFDLSPKRKHAPVVATKRAHFIASIENANKLEEQILTVQNATIEEYDNFLENHKEQLFDCMGDNEHEDDLMAARDMEMEIDAAHQQLLMEQKKFEKCIADINLELELLSQQRGAMMEQLQVLEENKPAAKEKRKKLKGETRPATRESSLSADLEKDEEEANSQMDPFALQERVFSRYAAMLYASDNNGKTFHEFKEAEYCKSCGEKTAMCPHKILRPDHVFSLPTNATHIKVSRPKVRINNDLIEETLREVHAGNQARLPVPSSKSIHSRMSISAQMSPLTPGGALGSEEPLTPAGGGGVGSETSGRYSGFGEGDIDAAHFIHSVDRLWDDFKTRTKLDRMVPRSLSMARVMSLMEQFSSYVCWQDELAYEKEIEKMTFGDSLYQFMHERYLKDDVMFYATHDLISAVVKFAPTNKCIWLFAQTLIGNLDASVFRYILLLGDIINEVEWKDVEDFKAFAEVIYPFLNEDDLDSFQMNYTSFSENTISSTLVAEFIVYNIMKYREPRFIEFENKLVNSQHSDTNFMTEVDFLEATDDALGVVNDKLRRRLYHEAFNYVKSKDRLAEGVPVARLAQITSYLSIVEVMQVIKGSIRQKVEVARASSQEDTSTGKPAHMRMSHVVAPQYDLLTWSAAQKLASNIARQRSGNDEQ